MSSDTRPGRVSQPVAPVVSFDYAFIGDDGEIGDQEGFEAAGEGAAKVLVVRDSKSKAVFAHVVHAKGADAEGYAVDCLVEDVKWLGYNKIILKSDNEPAIIGSCRRCSVS